VSSNVVSVSSHPHHLPKVFQRSESLFLSFGGFQFVADFLVRVSQGPGEEGGLAVQAMLFAL